jgi:DNA primase
MQFLAICYNEGCLNEPANRRAFIQMLDDPSFAEAVVRRGKIVNPASTETFLPGACTPLHELTDSHLARQYIRSRGYDPDVLGRTYRVSYCAKSHYNLASNRIIIPVYDGDRLRGWQARYIGELPWKGGKKRDLPPKYFSCPGSNFRSQCIFNFDRMSKWTTGIIVEGTTDVFAIGSMAGAIFGNSMTDVQKRRLLAVFAERTVVLLLDPEEFESKLTQRTIRELSAKMPKRFCAVRLPDATDPGSLSREFTKAYVKEEAARQGVKVSYKRVRDGR